MYFYDFETWELHAVTYHRGRTMVYKLKITGELNELTLLPWSRHKGKHYVLG